MLSGATLRACETTGTAVFRIVVSSDSMKNATATSHGRSRLLAVDVGSEGLLIGRVPRLAVWLSRVKKPGRCFFVAWVPTTDYLVIIRREFGVSIQAATHCPTP